MAGSTLRDALLSDNPSAANVAADAASANLSSNDVAARDPWIFREGQRTISGPGIIRAISLELQRGSVAWVDALIQAGELEAALADASHPFAASSADLTDALAMAVCSGDISHASKASQLLAQIRPPDWVSVSPPEGFTYYALHPMDFARVTLSISPGPAACAVIGIRSIGTTLSAMAVASLGIAGRPTSRITVRPTGHPYSRTTEFDQEQKAWVRNQAARGSQFIIVDEGPGRSGSTFLSVAEALADAGIERGRITMIGSREPDLESLCAQDAADRWTKFRYIATSPSVNERFKDCTYVGGGSWRQVFLSDERAWPESWTQTERLKFLSPDRRILYKFEGMGRIGADIRHRALALSQARFIPQLTDARDGFLAYEVVPGKHVRPSDISSPLIEQMARYCAFRASNFAVDHGGPSDLKTMVEFNLRQEFGADVRFRDEELTSSRPVLVDGRMQPWEWVSAGPEKFIKTDAVDHGDNHFFPGPCDIAWDIAGTIIEWQLSSDAIGQLLNAFRLHGGDDVAPRLQSYLLAYATFRAGFCRMARDSVRGSEEEGRLNGAYLRYRQEAHRWLQLRTGGGSRRSL